MKNNNNNFKLFSLKHFLDNNNSNFQLSSWYNDKGSFFCLNLMSFIFKNNPNFFFDSHIKAVSIITHVYSSFNQKDQNIQKIQESLESIYDISKTSYFSKDVEKINSVLSLCALESESIWFSRLNALKTGKVYRSVA